MSNKSLDCMILLQLHLKDWSALNLQLYIACIWFLSKQHNYLLKKQTPASYLKTSLKEKKDMSCFVTTEGMKRTSCPPSAFELQIFSFVLSCSTIELQRTRMVGYPISRLTCYKLPVNCWEGLFKGICCDV